MPFSRSRYSGARRPLAVAQSFSAPVRLGFEAGDDWEPAIAADRFGHVYAFWNHYGFDPGCPECPEPHMELQISSDGGSTWSDPRALLPAQPPSRTTLRSSVDPVDGKTVYTAFMLGAKASQYVARSDDFGQTWRPMLVEPLERGTDKDILAVRGDDVYLVYNAVQKIYASVSHDGGKTWATHRVVANTNSNFGWSLPAGGAIDAGGQRVLRLGRLPPERQALGPGQPLRHEIDRRRGNLDDHPSSTCQGRRHRAAAAGGPIGERS